MNTANVTAHDFEALHIPTHWRRLRAKYLFRCVQRPVRTGDEIITAFRDGKVTLRRNRREEGFMLAVKEVGYQGVRRGDLVIQEMDAFAGAIGVADSDGKCSPEYSVCVPLLSGTSTEFFAAYLRYIAHAGVIHVLGKGVRERAPRFRFSEFKELSLPVPPPEEQHVIVNFLSRKTTGLDALIKRKERLIEFLQEKRQALVTQAVTKGITPMVSLKPSGIAWIGDVPSHWSVAPLYAYYTVQLGKMLNPQASSGANLAPYLRNSDVQWGQANTVDLPSMSFSPEERRKFALRLGDLLVCEGGDVGRTAIWREELPVCFYQKAVHRLRPHIAGQVPQFFYYVMVAAAGRGAFLAEGNKSTIIHLTAEQLRVHRFPFPPVSEQAAIAAHLDTCVKRLDELIDRMSDAVSRLREYRRALISAAVTGQLEIQAVEAA